jgi:hypothetical protein
MEDVINYVMRSELLKALEQSRALIYRCANPRTGAVSEDMHPCCQGSVMK